MTTSLYKDSVFWVVFISGDEWVCKSAACSAVWFPGVRAGHIGMAGAALPPKCLAMCLVHYIIEYWFTKTKLKWGHGNKQWTSRYLARPGRAFSPGWWWEWWAWAWWDPALSTRHLLPHLILRTALHKGHTYNSIWQMRKLRIREINLSKVIQLLNWNRTHEFKLRHLESRTLTIKTLTQMFMENLS